MGIPDACLVDIQRIPEDLICAVCSEFCSHPVQTPCYHVFCRSCIDQAAVVASVCPICRSNLKMPDVKSIADVNPIAHRIWSKAKVRCCYALQHACEWIGSAEDFDKHKSACNGKKVTLCVFCRDTASLLDTYRKDLASAKQQRDRALAENKRLGDRVKELEQKLEDSSQIDFDPTYRYDRFTVIELSQLISKFLTDKPSHIDSNRIYNIVKKIRDDNARKWHDNPEHLEMDLQMLLTTCKSSTWFTPRQFDNMEDWLRELFEN